VLPGVSLSIRVEGDIDPGRNAPRRPGRATPWTILVAEFVRIRAVLRTARIITNSATVRTPWAPRRKIVHGVAGRGGRRLSWERSCHGLILAPRRPRVKFATAVAAGGWGQVARVDSISTTVS